MIDILLYVPDKQQKTTYIPISNVLCMGTGCPVNVVCSVVSDFACIYKMT